MKPVPITMECYPVRRRWVRLAAQLCALAIFVACAAFTAGVLFRHFT